MQMEFVVSNRPSHANQVISFARIRAAENLMALQADVLKVLAQSQSHSWVDHVNKRDFMGVWDVLPLRCLRKHVNAHALLQSFAIAADDEWENLPVLDDCPAIQSLLTYLQCPIKAARLMRLSAGAEIKPHRDHQLSIEFGEARLHVPIQTSNLVNFIVDSKTIPMRAGELWYFNADQVHEVYNRGSEDRINLVIDCVANDWLRKQIVTGAQNE